MRPPDRAVDPGVAADRWRTIAGATLFDRLRPRLRLAFGGFEHCYDRMQVTRFLGGLRRAALQDVTTLQAYVATTPRGFATEARERGYTVDSVERYLDDLDAAVEWYAAELPRPPTPTELAWLQGADFDRRAQDARSRLLARLRPDFPAAGHGEPAYDTYEVNLYLGNARRLILEDVPGFLAFVATTPESFTDTTDGGYAGPGVDAFMDRLREGIEEYVAEISHQ